MTHLSLNSLEHSPEPIEYKRTYVTPDLARTWLKLNGKNRKLVPSTVDRYAKEMIDGNWHQTGETIKFSKRGLLVDGQHRLWAVASTGIAQWFDVAMNVDDQAQKYMDAGRSRTLCDRLVIGDSVGHVGNREVATANGMFKNAKNLQGKILTRTMTVTEIETVFVRYGEAIKFACDSVSKGLTKGFDNAQIRSPIARAYYHMDHDVLIAFCNALATGDMSLVNNKSVLSLYKLIISESQSGKKVSGERYQKVERTLIAVKNGESLTKIYTASQELFPLPGEEELPMWSGEEQS